MAALLDQKLAVRLLREHGWQVTGQARHGLKMVRRQRVVILPRHHDQPYGKSLNRAIVRQAGLNPKEVTAWISRSKYVRRDRGIGRAL
jgi:predicted RNA binding protein YcfA (HicA-like mRNA interferase family)